MDKKKFRSMEIVGVIFTFLMGGLLYFSYELTDGQMWAVLAGAANHSSWEEIKVFLLPYLFWAGIEFAIVKPSLHRLLAIKAFTSISLMIGLLLIGFLFTVLSVQVFSLIGECIIFLILCCIYFLSYILMISKLKFHQCRFLPIFIIFLFFSFYIWLTTSPPHCQLFYDTTVEHYGILPHNLDEGAFVMNKNLLSS